MGTLPANLRRRRWKGAGGEIRTGYQFEMRLSGTRADGQKVTVRNRIMLGTDYRDAVRGVNFQRERTRQMLAEKLVMTSGSMSLRQFCG